MINSQKAVKIIGPNKLKIYIALAVILLVSFIAYLPVFHNEFVNWDDVSYIIDNPLICSINTKAIDLEGDYAQVYYKRGITGFYSGKKAPVCSDPGRAADLGYKPAEEALSQLCH
jgi:hypothetical protein